MDIFKRLIKMAGAHLPRFILALLCMLVVGTTTAALAFLIKPAMDDIFLNKDAVTLKWLPVAVIVIYLFKGICSWLQTVLMNFIGLRIVTDLRDRLYQSIQRQSLTFFTKNPTGILMSRITNDVTLIQAAVSEAVTSLLKDSFMLIGLVFVIFYRDWKLAVIAMFVFPLAVYPIAKFGSKLRHFATRTQVTMGSLSDAFAGNDFRCAHRQGLRHGGA